ncbi:MAG: pyrroline-5-carboxylate reductase [Coriobacteriales bacterium]|nr:pyrroline-5-carboxylate reductase [Coriobacteriales bacterium]
MGTIGTTVGILGAGSMGGAIARGLVLSGAMDAKDVWSCDPVTACLEPLQRQGINVTQSAQELVEAKTEVFVIAVKPQILADVVSPLADALANRLVVSIAAGVPLSTLEALLPQSVVVRVMPNLPIQVLSGATAVAPGSRASAQQTELVRSLFAALGSAQVMREDQLDAEGAVVSCGPAYIALFVDVLTRAGIRRGLPAAACREMVEATMLGVARTLLDTGEHPRAYLERVTSPGGTTAAGLYALEPLLVEGAYAAVDAALQRTAELANG